MKPAPAAVATRTELAARTPFGLPAGSVRGLLALLICGFVWIVVLWPADVRLPLAHFFLASMVFMAFVSQPALVPVGGTRFIPWVLRVLFAVGTVGVLAYAVFADWHRVTDRMVPDVEQFKAWWLTYLGVTIGGFLGGRVVRLVLGNGNPFFQSLRAWLAVLALFMMAGEFLLFIANASDAGHTLSNFLHYWQAVQLAAVSAYFASRT